MIPCHLIGVFTFFRLDSHAVQYIAIWCICTYVVKFWLGSLCSVAACACDITVCLSYCRTCFHVMTANVADPCEWYIRPEELVNLQMLQVVVTVDRISKLCKDSSSCNYSLVLSHVHREHITTCSCYICMCFYESSLPKNIYLAFA